MGLTPAYNKTEFHISSCIPEKEVYLMQNIHVTKTSTEKKNWSEQKEGTSVGLKLYPVGEKIIERDFSIFTLSHNV